MFFVAPSPSPSSSLARPSDDLHPGFIDHQDPTYHTGVIHLLARRLRHVSYPLQQHHQHHLRFRWHPPIPPVRKLGVGRRERDLVRRRLGLGLLLFRHRQRIKDAGRARCVGLRVGRCENESVVLEDGERGLVVRDDVQPVELGREQDHHAVQSEEWEDGLDVGQVDLAALLRIVQESKDLCGSDPVITAAT